MLVSLQPWPKVKLSLLLLSVDCFWLDTDSYVNIQRLSYSYDSHRKSTDWKPEFAPKWPFWNNLKILSLNITLLLYRDGIIFLRNLHKMVASIYNLTFKDIITAKSKWNNLLIYSHVFFLAPCTKMTVMTKPQRSGFNSNKSFCGNLSGSDKRALSN